MSKGTINKVMLIGRLGDDPEIRYAPTGDAIANFTVATNDGYKDKDGQFKDNTDWHKVSCYRRLAEFVREYTKKGSLIYLEGKLKTRKWQDDKGEDRYTTYIQAYDIQLLGAKSNEAVEDNENSPPKDNRPKLGKQSISAQNSMGKFEDDDIPF